MEWISVEDRLPDDMVEVLVIADGNMAIAFHRKGTWSSEDAWLLYDHDITHWQPLPPPPVDTKE